MCSCMSQLSRKDLGREGWEVCVGGRGKGGGGRGRERGCGRGEIALLCS